jgi:uncharacterized protein
MKLIDRTFYLHKLINVMETPDIKVITGVRRCGKSKLLEAFIRYLKDSINDSNVIYINYNLVQYEALLEYHALGDYINKHYVEEKINFVCIDEVQMCPNFEKAINGLHASEKFDIYITGSNAFLLSSDLATLFTGRTFEIEVYPFSLNEYMQYYNFTDIYDTLDRYVLEGGMAGSYLYRNQEDKYKYVADVFNMLIVRDIRRKYKIRNTILMDCLVDFLMDNIGNTTSARKVADTLNSERFKTNDKSISSYLNYLCNAFVFYKVRRYDIQGKKYLSTQDKYYLCDHSFRYALLGTRNMNYGRTLENIVAMELMRRGYELYVGVLYKKEIDFVAIKQNEKLYIQVSDNISNTDTFKREYEPLLKIKDAYPKLILARTKHDMYDHEGIQVWDIGQWIHSVSTTLAPRL